jgi:hypothetical protein
MIVNEAIEHGDYKVDFQPLDANVFQDAQEIEKIERTIPNFSKMSPALQRRLLDSGQGFTPNVAVASVAQANSYTSGPINIPQTNGEVYEVGYSAGGGLGGTSTLNPANEYHLDIKFDKSMPMQQVVEQFDKMAYAYMKTNQEIAFSNQGVSGIKYNPADSYTNKIKLLTNVFKAHSHSVTTNMNSGDFYVVPKGGTAWDSGAENAKVVAPSLPGGSIDSQISTGYGGSVNIKDRAGKVVITLGHLNKDIMRGNQ